MTELAPEESTTNATETPAARVAPAPRRAAPRLPRFGLGSAIVLGVVGVAIVGPFVSPYPVDAQDLLNRLQPPPWMEGGGREHLLGTDALGRDTFSRLISGTRSSMIVSATATFIALSVGTMIGLLAGYLGGWVEALTMRLGEVQLAFPSLLLAIALAVYFKPGIFSLIAILAIGGWITYARVVRGTVLSLKTSEFVTAARVIGATDARIVRVHIFPNTIPLIMALASFQLAGFIIAEASLSFLGLGIPPPFSSWGGMLAEGRPYLADQWWLCVIPGTAIMISVLGANLFGDAVRVWLDPRSQENQ